MFNTSALHIILSLLNSGKLQKAHCQSHRTLIQLRSTNHFAEMVFTTAGCCRHTTIPCFTTGKLSHGETKWLGQESFSENSGRAKWSQLCLYHGSIDYIFLLSVILQGHSKYVEFCFDTFAIWLFFLNWVLIYSICTICRNSQSCSLTWLLLCCTKIEKI